MAISDSYSTSVSLVRSAKMRSGTAPLPRRFRRLARHWRGPACWRRRGRYCRAPRSRPGGRDVRVHDLIVGVGEFTLDAAAHTLDGGAEAGLHVAGHVEVDQAIGSPGSAPRLRCLSSPGSARPARARRVNCLTASTRTSVEGFLSSSVSRGIAALPPLPISRTSLGRTSCAAAEAMRRKAAKWKRIVVLSLELRHDSLVRVRRNRRSTRGW